ncbi:MAG TPA: MFS transporter [Aggregatilinea sp.]|uniref:MFS transporter n=1 Tax=Aggregatilinea sp. TaxID=2806333 RepID=UPI002BEA1AB2|nr:MFS transporter [Aggregatilinea sp.]HML24053.1 MFS transporter [Aggregatilinea sp.]
MSEATHVPENWKTPFFTVWIGQAFSLFGSSLVQFALVWWLADTTNSATVLATATLVAMLPQIVIGPVAGSLVDRWNRRLVMMAADGFVALVTVALAILFATGEIAVWHVYVAAFIRSLGGAFHFPAMQASTSLMVPKDQLARVAGLNQTLQGAMSIVAPPVGAILLESLPIQAVLSVDVLTAIPAIGALFFVAIPQPPRAETPEAGAEKANVWQDLVAGLRYVRAWPALMIVLGMATLINFVFNPASSLTPLLIKNHFNGGAVELGWFESAMGIGVVLGGLALSVWGGFKRKIYTSMLGLIGMGTAAMIIGLTPGSLLALAVAMMFLMGFMNPITNGPLFAAIQSTVAPEMQGRVFTLVIASASAMSPLGLAVAGPVADVIGVRGWYFIAGLVCTGMGVSGYLIPALAHMEDGVVDAVAVEAVPAAGVVDAMPEPDGLPRGLTVPTAESSLD